MTRLVVVVVAVLIADVVAVAVHHSPAHPVPPPLGGGVPCTVPAPLFAITTGSVSPITSPSLTGATVEGDPRAARAFAAALLTRALIPPHASTTGHVPTVLAQPPSEPATPNLVDVERAWRIPTPADAAIAFVATHAPIGTACIGTGSSGDASGLTSENVSFSLSAPPAGFESAQLLLSVAATSATSSTLRVDAEVIFRPPTVAAEQVPSTDDTVTVARTELLGATTRRQVTDPATVRHLAALIDGLAPAVPGESNCPSLTTIYVLTFGPAANYVATTGACSSVTISRNGSSISPVLFDPNQLVTRAALMLVG